MANATSAVERPPRGRLVHEALFYSGPAELATAITEFVVGGNKRGQAALVAVPGEHGHVVRASLKEAQASATLVDMRELGHNPGRIIPAVRRFVAAHPGGVRFVGEPIWNGRTQAEVNEATRHEALLNLAFRDDDAHILCPYDASCLEGAVLEDAELTHPHLLWDGQRHDSKRYAGWPAGLEAGSKPLADLGRPHGEFEFERGDLSLVRSIVRRQTERVPLGECRAHDLLLAVNEAASNSLAHADRTGGRLRVWRLAETVVCEITDDGRIADPLAGRVEPELDRGSGRGLWMMHQLCDLVELRTGASGTTLRLHMGPGRHAAEAAA